MNQRLFRYWTSCYLYNINNERVEKIKSQLESYIGWNRNTIFDGNLYEYLNDIIIKYSDFNHILSFKDKDGYSICELTDAEDILDERDNILEYIQYYIMLECNKYIVEQLTLRNINLEEDYK